MATTTASNPTTTTTQTSTTPVSTSNTIVGDKSSITSITTTTSTQTEAGLKFGSTQSSFDTNLGERVIDTSLISNIRSRNVYFSAYNLKPLTKLHAFFDNVNVDEYITPSYRVVLNAVVHTDRTKTITRTNSKIDVIFAKGKTIYITQAPIDSTLANGYLAVSDTFTWDGITYTVVSISQSTDLTTDANGYVAGTFLIPNTTKFHFNAGSRAFLLCDSINNNAVEITTSAEFMYYASGMIQSKQAQTLSTRINQVTIDATLKSTTTSIATEVVTPIPVAPLPPVVAVDSSAPTIVSYSPGMGATGIAVSDNIVITFNENIVKNTGTITLKKSNGTVVETFAMPGSSLVTTSGATLTINPTSPLNQSTSYVVDLPYGCVVDTATVPNLYAGSSNYSFTTDEPAATPSLVPILYLPSDGSLDINTNTKVGIQFNRAIAKGTGNIVLRTSAGTVETINVATSTNVTIVNDYLTIAFTNLLTDSTNYYLDFPNTAIKDTAGSPVYWAGTTTYDFTTGITKATAAIASGSISIAVGQRLEEIDYVLDFTSATGECGFDITEFAQTNSGRSFIISAQLYWDGQKDPIAGTGGTPDKPCFLWNGSMVPAIKTQLEQLYPGATFQNIDLTNTSSKNPLKFRFNKTKATPTKAILKIVTDSFSRWNQVLPSSVTVVEGKAQFSAGVSNIDSRFSATERFDSRFIAHMGFDSWNNAYSKDTIIDVAGPNYGVPYTNAFGTQSLGPWSGFLTIQKGTHTMVGNISNFGTAAGNLTSIDFIPGLNNLVVPNISIVNNEYKVYTPNSTGFSDVAVFNSLPITIPPRGNVVFNITFTWPYQYYQPPFDWVAKTGLSSPISVGEILALPNSSDIIADYKKNVLDVLARRTAPGVWQDTTRGTIAHWDLAFGFTNQETGTTPLSTNIDMFYYRLANNTVTYTDPLAQTFFIDSINYPDGYFLSSVDLFFKSKSTIADITVQIRPVVNGYPSSSDIIPFAVSSLTPDSINLTSYPDSTNSSSYTKFKFDSPIYLVPGTYAIIVISPSKDYEIFTSTVGGLRLNDLESRITEVPYAGDLFKSSNGQTWLPSPYQDMCFVINRADFSSSGTIAFSSKKPMNDTKLTYNTFQPITQYNQDDIIRVEVSTNTDNVYKVLTSGVSGNTEPTHTTGTVTNGTVSMEFVETSIRRPDVEVPYDAYFTQGEKITFKNTDAKYYYKSTDTSGVIDTDFTETMIGSTYDMDTRKLLDSNNKNLYAKVELTTSDSKLSPIIDITRMSNVLVRNLTNSVTIAPDFVANTDVVSGDYIKVLDNSNYRMYVVINSGTTSDAAPVFVGSDTLNGSALLRYVGITNNGDTELLPSGGLADSRYITRKVTLASGFESTDIVVRFNANTPTGSSVKVYYKAAFIEGEKTLESAPYHEMVLSERASDYNTTFVEHKFVCDYGDNINPLVRYALPNKERFNQFAIKIVLLSTNTVVVPKVKDLRVIALDD